MQANRNLPVCRTRKFAHVILAAALTLLPAALIANAQSSNPGTKVETFHLTNTTQQNDANEIVTALRNMVDPHVKIYLVASQNAIVMDASPDQLDLAQKLISELDKPHKLYRLTYTLTTMDGSKPISTTHYSMVVADGQRTSMKQGSKMPIITGIYKAKVDSSAAQTQYQYLGIGMNFDATVTATANGVWLKSKVEQTSLAPEKPDAAIPDPILLQTSIEGDSLLTSTKPLVFGSLAIPNTTHRLEIEVEAQPIS